MLKILYKSKNLLIISKPQGMPSQPDPTGSLDALSASADALRSGGEDPSLWLVHRLDRVVGGVMAFARNKQTAARLSELVGGNGMQKEYIAVVEGKADGGVLKDYIFKDSAKSKAFVTDAARRGAKEASLEYERLSECQTERGIYTLVRIKLHTGRYHQIRVQLASRKNPLVGDGKYGSRDNAAKMPALHACRVCFSMGKEKIDITEMPDSGVYPWSLFKEKLK